MFCVDVIIIAYALRVSCCVHHVCCVRATVVITVLFFSVVRFQLMADQVPRTAGRRSGRGADSEAGLTALAFSPDNPDQFILGSEGGGIFLCSFASEVPIAGE